jgi:NAD(P)-dependent dehydrogenase (short-subunit alcohol dehydrogenase family)
MSPARSFENQVVLISGGSSGIGLATARRFAEGGARLVLVARDEARLRAAGATLPGAGHEIRVADATNEEAMAALLKTLKEQLGAIHVGVCCAGAHAVRPLAVSKAKNFEELYQQNVISAVNTIRPLIKAMPAEGGAIVLVSSVAGLRGAAAAAAYSAAKGALLSLTRSLAVEGARAQSPAGTGPAG